MALTDEEIVKRIIDIIRRYLPECKIILFGSRATGTYSSHSDFDIALDTSTPIPLNIMARIREEMENIPTLKMFDILTLAA